MASVHHRERSIARTREEILQAASTVFAAKGFGGATIQDIARAAGYTAPTLYAYFEGKAAIFEALVQTVTAEYLAAFEEELPAGLTFEQRLEILVRRLLTLAEKRRFALTTLFTATAVDGAAAREITGRKRPQGFEVCLAAMTRWVRAWAPEEWVAPPEDLACIIFGAVNVFVRRELLQGTGNLPARTCALVDLILNRRINPRQNGAT